ncbi:Protein AIR2 [Cytospora mali]|uniref:Protein AIR2 n=1 Tax=Cytospora mali TaxID=578113 RepID=A0A194W993_CYTMA|nr:Protein AIR2 [Valsa mali]
MAAVSAEMKRPAEGDGSVSPRKKARKNPTVSEGEASEGEASEGEVSDGVDEGEVDSDEDFKVPEEAAPGRATTWNGGITNKLRTSFGASSQPAEAPQKPEPLQDSEPGLDTPSGLNPEVRDGLAAAFRADEKRACSPVADQYLLWELPAFNADSVVGNTWSEVLNSILTAWCPEFMTANQATIDQVGLGGSLLKKAFSNRLKGVPKLSPGLISTFKRQLKQRYKETRLKELVPGFKPSLGKRMGKGMRREAKERAKEIIELESKQTQPRPENPTRIQPSRRAREKETTPNTSSSSDDSSLSADIDVDDSVEGSNDKVDSTDMKRDVKAADIKRGSGQLTAEDELEQRHRYYPGLPDDAVFCLTCASYDHATADCPEATCKFCQQDHFSYQCPSRQRCGKCKQLGHAKSSCKEKLAVAPGEGFYECAFCEAQDHQEDDCTEIWQTYRPQVGHTKKVKSMPIFCYCCGAEGHFGADCGLANPKLPLSETWTLATASLYLDPASSEEATAYKAVLPQASATSVSAPVIPGRSIKPQSHIIFEDSGDEDADTQSFIRAPAAIPKRPGQISITSNINFGAMAAGISAQQGGGGAFQQQETPDARQRRRQRQQQHKAPQPPTLPPKPTFASQKGSQQRGGAPPPPAPPPASKKGKKKGRGGKNAQPPLPSGPPPGPPSNGGWRPQEFMPQHQQDQGRGGNRNRGRGGFSSLGRGGARGGRGRRNN